jgi:hypothetical protein
MCKEIRALIVAGLFACCAFGCKFSNDTDHSYPGAQWLSWGADVRSEIVFGYIQGHGDGMYQACTAVGKLGDDDERFYILNGIRREKISYERCHAGVSEYSNFKEDAGAEPDFHTYANTITEFYSRHAEYRNIPFFYLMQFLTDKEHKTAEELYSMARAGEMRTRW